MHPYWRISFFSKTRLCTIWVCFMNFVFRAIPLKKQEGWGKSPWPPRTKLGFFSPPGPKRVFSLPPLGHKTGFFTPLGHVFFFWPPPDSFVQFYPLRQFSPPIFPPSDSFLSILPPWTAFFTHFTRLVQLFLLPRTVCFSATFHPLLHPFLCTSSR